jgi:hypothetical protein
MTKLLNSQVLRATIFCLIALVLLTGAALYGFSNPMLAHGPNPPPDNPVALPPPGSGSSLLAHGPNPPPDNPVALPPPGSTLVV